MNALRQMLWKEFRENLLWAALIAAAFGIALAYGWSKLQDPYNHYAYHSFMWETLLVISRFGGPIAGLALGFLQTIPEWSRDRWAYLIHRPISPGRIFLAKAAAGITLYLLATGVPYAVLCWTATRPGALAAPVYLELSLAGWMNLLGGLPFYFGAMLTTLREARWTGSRGWGLLAALAAIASSTMTTAGMEAFRLAGFTLAIACAAAGAFLAHSGNGAPRWWFKTGLALTLLWGAWGLLFLLSLLAQMARPQSEHAYTENAIHLDGRPVQVTARRGSPSQIIDEMGGAVEISKEAAGRSELWRVPEGYFAPSRIDVPFFENITRNYHRQIWNKLDQLESVGSTIWYFSTLENKLLAYDRFTRQRVAEGGPDGISRPPDAPAMPFPGFYTRNYYAALQFRTGVYAVDFYKETITPILETSGPEQSAYEGSAVVKKRYDAPFENLRIFTVMNGVLTIQSPDAQPVLVKDLPKLDKKYQLHEVAYHYDLERAYAFYGLNWNTPSKDRKTLPTYIWEADLKTGTDRLIRMPPIDNSREEKHWTDSLLYLVLQPWEKVWNPASLWFKAKFLEPAYLPVWERRWNTRHQQLYRELRQAAWTGLAAALAACGWITFHGGIRKPRAWVAPALVFATGVPGLLALLAWKTWKAPAVPTHPPAPDGTEIFTLAAKDR